MRLAIGAALGALLLGIVAGTGALLGGCKEGLGERCQVDADCASGLVCNQAQAVCAEKNSGEAPVVPDVGLPMDAPAPPADAAGDAADAT